MKKTAYARTIMHRLVVGKIGFRKLLIGVIHKFALENVWKGFPSNWIFWGLAFESIYGEIEHGCNQNYIIIIFN